ncbi:hypothetical protein ABIG06_003334 [Bradyrhizobium sp. USDA 326]|uniref:hypothetical protein n=1 Tax=Bradyrhizobium sp. RP6 TaxID=2489596 RepID=UPI001FDA4A7F|nr:MULTISPECIES: hypothetical protein [Bradyrhizobium]UWU93444.1 hypothetical protein N2604_05660 [Bradyrhizobium sp. CB1015]
MVSLSRGDSDAKPRTQFVLDLLLPVPREIAFDAASDRVDKLFNLERLDEIVDGAILHRLDAGPCLVLSRQKQQWCLASNPCLVGLKIETADARQPHIQYDAVKWIGLASHQEILG